MAYVVSGTEALQMEKVLSNPKFCALPESDNTAYNRIKASTDAQIVSNRQTRIPIDLLQGGVSAKLNNLGGPMPRGKSYTPGVMTLPATWFAHACEINMLDLVANDSKEKSVENYFAKSVADQPKSFAGFLDGQLFGDGTGSYGAISAVDTSTISGYYILTVPNSHLIQDSQVLAVYNSAKSALIGNVLVQSVDNVNNKVMLANTIPSQFPTSGTDAVSAPASLTTVATGCYLAPYRVDLTTTDSSLYGIQYYQNSANTGTLLGLDKGTYFGKLNPPSVSAAGGPPTPALVRKIFNLMRKGNGVNSEDIKNACFFGDLDQQASWENQSTLITSIIGNQVGGKESFDRLKELMPTTIAGREFVASNRATPNRLDILCLNNWGRAEVQPMQVFSVGGNHIFQSYDTATGAVATRLMFYMWWGGNFYNKKPLAGGFIPNLATPY